MRIPCDTCEDMTSTCHGCDFCQRRRIKCDHQLPCSSCRSRNIECRRTPRLIRVRRDDLMERTTKRLRLMPAPPLEGPSQMLVSPPTADVDVDVDVCPPVSPPPAASSSAPSVPTFSPEKPAPVPLFAPSEYGCGSDSMEGLSAIELEDQAIFSQSVVDPAFIGNLSPLRTSTELSVGWLDTVLQQTSSPRTSAHSDRPSFGSAFKSSEKTWNLTGFSPKTTHQ
mmetsp:Transcript_20669/g.41356  ORF Transcript_20669/g.41356 Transcript_20669/m.41356 type:complete len:224 (-) Transcript_20669:134-805(-)